MKTSPRRALSVILAAALLLGSVPQGVSAQVIRVASGQTGSMPVSPVNASAAGMTLAPALNIGAASLQTSFSAPMIAPSPVASQSAAALQTPVSAAPIALSASVQAAASEAAPKLPDAPKAAAPVAKKTWTERLTSMLGRKSAPAATPAPSSEAAKADADKTFDGATEKEAAAEGTPVSAGKIIFTRTGLKASLVNRLAVAQEKRKLQVDEFGGPLSEPMTFKQRVGYGLKQGLHLVGIGALLNVTLRPFLDLFPWPQYLSDATLSGF